MSGGWGGAEGERENLQQTACSARSQMQGLIPRPWDHDLSPNQESDGQAIEPRRRPEKSQNLKKVRRILQPEVALVLSPEAERI